MNTASITPIAPLTLRSIAEPLGTVPPSDPDAAEKLRAGFINLSMDIATLVPAVDGERANDPIILRVARLKQERDELLALLKAVVGEGPVASRDGAFLTIAVPAHLLRKARRQIAKIEKHD